MTGHRTTPTGSVFAALRLRAETEPIGLDISDCSDEWCDGFLAGQVSILEEIEWGRLELPSPPRCYDSNCSMPRDHPGKHYDARDGAAW